MINRIMFAIALTMTTIAVKAQTTVGATAPDFTLTDIKGTAHSLSDFKGKVVVLEWTNYDCPFVKKHYGSGNMQALQKRYTEKGVIWLTICSSAPGKQGNLSAEEWKTRSETAKSASTAILPDPTGTTGKAFGATATPHMFVIDTKGVLAYKGAIDDNPSSKPETIKGATNYVVAAVDAVLAGKPVATQETKAYGCSVKY